MKDVTSGSGTDRQAGPVRRGFGGAAPASLVFLMVDCPETSQIIMALDLYVQENIDFVDAYHAYHMKEREIEQIATYDRKHFGRVPWVEIREP